MNLKGKKMTVIPLEKAKKAAPGHLRPETGRWYRAVIENWELQDHHARLLLIACEAWDRGLQAREALDQEGLTYLDRFNAPHAHPAVKIERDSRITFARMVRELDLDIEPPPPSSGRRPPTLRSNRPGSA
jgi:P27 family predicted phage terminase small subunit